jgi:ATP-dependent 26S proteasome regulatory subunit
MTHYIILINCTPGYAKEHEPCIIFMDEIDAIGGRRFSEGTSADREIQRTLMEVLKNFRSKKFSCGKKENNSHI